MFDAVPLTHPRFSELILVGEFDFTQDERVRETWQHLMQSAPHRVLIDASGLTFADGTAARFLLRCTREAATGDHAVALVTGANERMHRLLHTLGWEQFLPVYPTRATAVTALIEAADQAAQARASASQEPRLCAGCPFPKQSQRLASLLDCTSDAVFSLDRDGRLTDVNAAAETLSGFSRQDLIGKHFAEFLPPDQSAAPMESVRRALAGEPQRSEAVILHREGRKVELDVTAVPIKIDGEVTGAFGVARDVTRRNQAERRISMLVETGRRLTATRDLTTTLAELGQTALPMLGDYAVMDLVQPDGSLRRLSAAHADPRRQALVQELLRHPVPEEILAEVMAGRSVLLRDPSETIRSEPARNEEHRRLLQQLHPQALMCVPLAARGRVLGVLTFARTTAGAGYTEEDLGVAEELARNAGLCLDNSRLYDIQCDIAHTLQRSLLPSELPRVPGFDAASCYHAAGELYEVGGDFYDLFPASGESWIALIGDVTGKGPAAAAITSVVRHTIRAAAHLTRWPRRMLERANTAVLEQADWDGLCTALCIRLTWGPRGLLARGTSAGHLPAILLRADGQVEVIESPGMMLGVMPALELREWAAELRPNDTLILYTDGVTEARLRGSLFGEERLHALIQSCAGLPAPELVQRVERAVLEFQEHELADDIAILAIRATQERPAPSGVGRGVRRQTAH